MEEVREHFRIVKTWNDRYYLEHTWSDSIETYYWYPICADGSTKWDHVIFFDSLEEAEICLKKYMEGNFNEVVKVITK